MAGPSKVEIEGQKKQRIRMRGTKQANEATAKRIRKNLDELLENPRVALPEMRFHGRLSWGRKDPVTKTLQKFESVIRNKNNVKWLTKKMVAKREEHLVKAFAGSLRAAHDEDISLVGNFSSGSFGSASFIRRGDGKQGYLAGIQNFNHVTLRLFPWEDHARHGMFFFSWEGGFVCTGPVPQVPEGWLEDVLKRSRFSFTSETIDGVDCFVTKGLEASSVHQGKVSGGGYVLLKFHHGPLVAIGFEEFEDTKKKESSFVHHLALSMLPPRLSSILDLSAVWLPDGWDGDEALPDDCGKNTDFVLNGWQGLTQPEATVPESVKNAVLGGIDRGVLIGNHWFKESNHEGIREKFSTMHGSKDEQELACELLLDAISSPHEESERLFIGVKGTVQQQDEGTLRIHNDAHCNDILSALWEHHGQAGLKALGLQGEEIDEIWQKQLDSPKPFGKFLKELEKNRELANKYKKFPRHEGFGCASDIEDYIVQGLVLGPGATERVATQRHKSIDAAASAWAWLVAANRSTGQEWHFDNDARDRGGVWALPAEKMLKIGTELLNSVEKSDELEQQWNEAFDELKVNTGQ